MKFTCEFYVIDNCTVIITVIMLKVYFELYQQDERTCPRSEKCPITAIKVSSINDLI